MQNMDQFTTKDSVFNHREESDRVKQQKELINIFIEIILSQSFRQLSGKEKHAYDLYRKGFSFEYISDTMGVSVEYAYSLKSRAERKIKELGELIKPIMMSSNKEAKCG